MNELVEAVQATVRREVAQVLRQAADTIDGNGKDRLGGRVPPPGTLPKLPQTIFNVEKQPKRGRPQGVGFRHQQVLDLLKRHPEGLAGPDIAERCGMKGTQVYGVLKRLQRDGKVKKHGQKGYVAAS